MFEFKIFTKNCFPRYQNWNKSFRNKGKVQLKSWGKWRRNVKQLHMKQIWKDKKLLSLLVLPGKMIMLVFVFLFYHQSYLSFKIRMLSEAFAWEINFSTIYIPIVFLYLPFILHYAFFYYSLISFTLLLYCKFLKAKIICGLF